MTPQLSSVVLALLPGLAQRGVEPAVQPNVLFILADDLGWMDSTPYGSRYYRTPGLERLASMGVRFTRAYAASPVCSPTRLSCMTGKYPARLKMTAPAGHLPPLPQVPDFPRTGAPHEQVLTPCSRTYLPTEEYTLGEAFRDAGYRTGFVGKWHLGRSPEHWPEAAGFDFVFHGAPDPGPPSYFSPYRFQTGTVADGPRGEYLTDRATEEALAFIRGAKDGPWMLCLWHWAVHTPLQAPRPLINEYAGARDPRGKQENPVMAAMIESLDRSVAVLLDALDELGLADDTIIVFTSDNGGSLKRSSRGPPATANDPLRGGKSTIYEGGTRVPAIVAWPGRVEGGTTSDALVSSIDFYPTLLEMAGIAPRANAAIDGISLVETLISGAPPAREAIFCHFPKYVIDSRNRPATYVIQGHWKYIRFYDGAGGEGPEPAALYDLASDIGERNNLCRSLPERALAMDALIARHLEHIGAVVPVPNLAYRETAYHPFRDEAIDMWVPSPDCDIRKADGALCVTSFGAKPSFSIEKSIRVPLPCTLSFRLKIETAGKAKVHWSETSGRRPGGARRKTVTLEHDGRWHEYRVELDHGRELRKLRIDPGNAAGEAAFEWIRLHDRDGELVQGWEFEG